MKKIALLLFFITQVTYAYDPWFTGPFFAESGHTVPKGHSELLLLGYNMPSSGIYDNEWQFESTPPFRAIEINPQFTYGLTDKLDVEWDVLYQDNRTERKTRQALGDTAILLGFQLLEQEESHRPDVRLTLEEIIPTGRFERLDPSYHGTDATGMGSYQTIVGLNFENTSTFQNNHTLKSFFSIDYLYAIATNIHGLSTYGGSDLTHGRIKPGNVLTLDLAGELSLTQNWVALLEGYFQYEMPSNFKGERGRANFNKLTPQQRRIAAQRLRGLFPSRHNIGGELGVGNGNVDEFTLAPGIEYNFTENCGVLMGTWFTVTGKNTPSFSSLILGLTLYW